MPSPTGLLRQTAYFTTRRIGITAGESFPFYYVSEYPKSGGTWTARMLADILRVPFPQNPLAPIAFSSVIQNHWTRHPRLRRVVYVHRDGRDVMTSFFFHRMRDVRMRVSPWWRKHAKEYERLFGRGYDPADSLRLLPRFIEHEFANPRGSRVNWAAHVKSWWSGRDDPTVAFVSYERLLENAASELKPAVERVSGRKLADDHVQESVDRFSMRRQTGRAAGQEDRNSFIRKGVAGDWKNHFSREAAEIFNDLAGDALVLLGYEPDRNWVDRNRSADRSRLPDSVSPRVSMQRGANGRLTPIEV